MSMKLFYLPNAGGTATSMYKWSGGLRGFIEPVPIELAGRGTRFNDGYYSDLHDAVEDIYKIFKDIVGDDDYALIGHSMGATLIFELYYKILSNNLKLPVHMFFSGSRPPYTRQKNEIIHILEDDLFINEVKKLGGLSNEFLNNDELKRIFIPVLKEDYKMLESYIYSEKISKIKCNISVMYGDEDFCYEELRGWRKLSRSKCFYEEFNGGHFYIESNTAKFASYINNRVIEEYSDERGINNVIFG